MGIGRFRSIYRTLKLLVLNKRSHGSSCIITTGYYPVEMIMLFLLKMMGFKVFSIIYDTHISSLAKFSRVKRFFAHWYFFSGLCCSGLLTGILTINKKAGSEFPIAPRRIFVTRIGNLFNNNSDFKERNNNHASTTVFLFAGTFNADNGIYVLLEAISLLPKTDARFMFYGSGDGEPCIRRIAEFDARVRCFGRVADDYLDNELISADFLICLRDPNSISTKYAFPSKLIKFMGSGTPVLANNFPGISDAMANCLLIIDEFSSTSVAKGISGACGKNLSDLGASARNYVAKWHDWDIISDEMIVFLNK